MTRSASAIAWERIRGLKEVIISHRDETDSMRRLPDAIADAFMAADVYRFQIPESLGGLELDPLTVFDLAAELSSYDGSVGWNFAIGSSGGVLLGALPPQRAKEIFSVPHCYFAASGAAQGKARAVEGGYRLTGRWAWASGIHQAAWVAGSALVVDGDAPRLDDMGKSVTRLFLVPKERVTVHDAWFTGGLRGTGSTEWSVLDCFVPQSDAFQVWTGKSEQSAPIFNLPSVYFGLTVTAVPLGIARHSIECLKLLALQKGSVLSSSAYAQYAVAKAEALYESSYLNVRESFRVIWENALAKRPHAASDRTRVRRSYVHAVEASIEAVTLCYEAAGGAAVFEAHAFERALRDVHAVRAHVVLSRRFMELAGQAAFGLPVASPLF